MLVLDALSWKFRERVVKEVLIDQLRSSNIDPGEVSEWLWEDFGVRVKPEWSRIAKAILSSRDITPQDLASFMISVGLMPEEGAWDVYPAKMLGLKKTQDASRGNEGG